MKLLIADGYQPGRNLIAAFAEALGWSPTLAVDGKAALDLVAQLDFDAFVFEQEMPDQSGLSVLAAIRGGAAGVPSAPALLWTAGDLTETRRAAQPIEDVTVVAKPLFFNDFKRWIDEVQRL